MLRSGVSPWRSPPAGPPGRPGYAASAASRSPAGSAARGGEVPGRGYRLRDPANRQSGKRRHAKALGGSPRAPANCTRAREPLLGGVHGAQAAQVQGDPGLRDLEGGCSADGQLGFEMRNSCSTACRALQSDPLSRAAKRSMNRPPQPDPNLPGDGQLHPAGPLRPGAGPGRCDSLFFLLFPPGSPRRPPYRGGSTRPG